MEHFKDLLPNNWKRDSTTKIFSVVMLEKEDDEYKEIERYFTSVKNLNVIEIKRIENKYAYTSVMIEKERQNFLKNTVCKVSKISFSCSGLIYFFNLGRFINKPDLQ